MTGSSWVDQLKPGDLVFVGDALTPQPVEAMHKLHVIVQGQKYKRTSGRSLYGGQWCRVYLRQATPENVSKAAALHRRACVARFAWAKAPQELIDAVYALLPAKS